MTIPNDRHIEFYSHQIKATEDEWENYLNVSIKILIEEKRLFIGRLWGLQEDQGNVILRFKRGSVPRMKRPYFLCFVGSNAPGDSSQWEFSYREFRSKYELPEKSTGIFPITYLNWAEKDWTYILVKGFDINILNWAKNEYLDKKAHPKVLIAETDPPIEYLCQLKRFVFQNPKDPILNLDVTINEEAWTPKLIDNRVPISSSLPEDIRLKNTIIIQGPPGTGKTYLGAELCKKLLEENYSICVTALTNKALMEVAIELFKMNPPGQHKIYKTNLSSDEKKDIPFLEIADNFAPRQGELMLSTYYKLSQKQDYLFKEGKRFDLLIIEEASQAYLATIAMFSSITKYLLILGDYKQLTPIVKREGEVKKIDENIIWIINGLKTFSFNNNQIFQQLTYTRRLTEPAAKQTGIYYNDTLKSISPLNNQCKFQSDFSKLFHAGGGTSIVKLSTVSSSYPGGEVTSTIAKIGYNILENNKDFEVALLTPYIETESQLYEQYSRLSSNFNNITINTIHRIQGLTCDIVIFYLPLNNPGFELNDNIFNVGTSRAKRGTLIFTYEHIDLLSSISTKTRKFLSDCQDVTREFQEIITPS